MTSFDVMTEGETPYFSMWYNQNDKSAQWNKPDYEAARKYLYDHISLLASTGDNSLYYLKIHPEAAKIYKRTGDEIASMPVRFNPFHESEFANYNGDVRMAGIGNGSAIADALRDLPIKLQEKFDAINERLEAMESPEEPEQPDTLTRIAGFLDHPTIGPAIGQVLGAILPKIIAAFPGLSDLASQNNAILQQAPQIAGINDTHTMTEEQKEEKLNEALDRLEPLCDLPNDLTLLANMAEKNKPMFDSMLAILRAQK